jgi:hypothetical protein
MDDNKKEDGIRLHLIICIAASVLCVTVAIIYYIMSMDMIYIFFAMASSSIINSTLKLWKSFR